MTTLEQLDRWLADGRISAAQHQQIAALVRRERVSVFAELNVALYLGVLAFTGGLAWTLGSHSAAWADLAILALATLAMLACFAYCVVKTPPYANGRVAAPTAVFDYVLYLGCLIFATLLGYLQYRFGVLEAQGSAALLLSAFFYLALAYRFDNRFVLSLGIATLGGWFGVRLSRFQVLDIETIRIPALTYAGAIAAAGVVLWYRRIKPHFLDAYLHVAANVALAAMLSGVFGSGHSALWLLMLLIASTVTIGGGIRTRHFAFVVYGTLFGYVGISSQVLEVLDDAILGLAYLTVSSIGVIIGLIAVARRVGKSE